jgi:hypothetical protein
MSNEITIPAFVVRISYDIMKEETLNETSLNRVLELAGLARLVNNPPPMDDSPSITRREFEKMIGVVWQVFDEEQVRFFGISASPIRACENRDDKASPSR